MPEIKREKAFVCKCSIEECKEIVKEVNNKFEVITDSLEINRRALLFKGLGHGIRLRILGLLAVQELCTCEIIAALEGAASTIAHHLKILTEGNLVTSRRVGKFTIFKLNNDLVKHHKVFDPVVKN